MESIDEEFLDASMKFIDKTAKADQPFFVWFNSSRMHYYTHISEKTKGRSGQEGSLMPTPPNPAPAQPVQEPTSKPKAPTGDNGVDAARREVKESEKR